MNEIIFELTEENNGFYTTKEGAKYKDVTIKATCDTRNTDNKTTTIFFRANFVTDEGVSKVLMADSLNFDQFNKETIVNIGTDEEIIEKELTQAVNDGWTYNKEKVLVWGYPDWLRVKGYYRLVGNIYQYSEDPVFAQIANDFLLECRVFEKRQLKENFKLKQ